MKYHCILLFTFETIQIDIRGKEYSISITKSEASVGAAALRRRRSGVVSVTQTAPVASHESASVAPWRVPCAGNVSAADRGCCHGGRGSHAAADGHTADGAGTPPLGALCTRLGGVVAFGEEGATATGSRRRRDGHVEGGSIATRMARRASVVVQSTRGRGAAATMREVRSRK